MGQYYYVANMDKQEYLYPHKLDNGFKLMEFSWQGNWVVNAMMNFMKDRWAGDTVLVVGDYADYNYDPEAPGIKTLNRMYEQFEIPGKTFIDDGGSEYEEYLFHYIGENFTEISEEADTSEPGATYLINHALKEYVDLSELPITEMYNDVDFRVAPLTLLLALGNGRGGGDYWEGYPGSEFVGSWADTVQSVEISCEIDPPAGYEEFVPYFVESSMDSEAV